MNEALKDRLDEAENELQRRRKNAEDKDKLLQRLNELLNDLERGCVDVRQPVDDTDGVGECLADLHRKYLDLLNDLENEGEKRKRQQKQVWESPILYEQTWLWRRNRQSKRLSPLRSWVRISVRTRTRYIYVRRVSQRSAKSRGFSRGTPVSSHLKC